MKSRKQPPPSTRVVAYDSFQARRRLLLIVMLVAVLTPRAAAHDIDFRLAHIHLGARGENGPIVVWLHPDGPPPVLIPGELAGVLAGGTITAADLIGPLQGMTLDDLLRAIENGNAYVNAHTLDHPGGEIRGQLE